MSMNVKTMKTEYKGFTQPILDAGTYPARTVQIIGLGLQTQRPYQGKEKPDAQEAMLTYELLDEFCITEEGDVQEDKPRWLSETFPMFSLESDLARSSKRYYALDPKSKYEGDFLKLVDVPVAVTITATAGKGKNEGRMFNNIGGVSTMRPKEADKAVELKNPTKVFDFYEPNMDVFMSLPEWIQKKMKDSPDFEGGVLQRGIANYKKDDSKEDKAKEDVNDEVKEEKEDDGEW